MIATKDELPRGWKVSLEIKPFAIYGGWSNVLHATIGRDVGRHGDRTPGIWFLPGTTRMHICSTVNGNTNYCHNTVPLPKDKQNKIIVQQVQNPNNYQYYYQIFINGKKVHEILNQQTQIFNNVKYYASDPWYYPAKATIDKFRLETYKHKGKDFLLLHQETILTVRFRNPFSIFGRYKRMLWPQALRHQIIFRGLNKFSGKDGTNEHAQRAK